jgi:hypothetical protein
MLAGMSGELATAVLADPRTEGDGLVAESSGSGPALSG